MIFIAALIAMVPERGRPDRRMQIDHGPALSSSAQTKGDPRSSEMSAGCQKISAKLGRAQNCRQRRKVAYLRS